MTMDSQRLSLDWRHGLLMALTLFPVALLFLLVEPIAQPQSYHDFADRRPFLAVPNFYDVASNLAFLFTGLAGIGVCLTRNTGPAGTAWITMFAGIGLVSAGSAFYHWSPSDHTLVWDRAAMTVGFMGLFVALLVEYVSARLLVLLVPLVVFGLFSVFYGYVHDDLRLYACVQFIPLLLVPIVVALFKGRYTHQWLLLIGLLLYLLAKVTEHFDHGFFQLTSEMLSGHTAKHLLAAVACFCLLLMLWWRQQR